MGKDNVDLIQKPDTKVQKPRLFRVLMLNDDYTPMDFVVIVLQEVFHKNLEEANAIMKNVHQKGVGVIGVYTHEIAETHVEKATDLARKNEEPLQLVMEPE